MWLQTSRAPDLSGDIPQIHYVLAIPHTQKSVCACIFVHCNVSVCAGYDFFSFCSLLEIQTTTAVRNTDLGTLPKLKIPFQRLLSM